MTTDQFTREDFEKALPAVPYTAEWVKGELVYTIPVFRASDNGATNKRIKVRSSIGRNGMAASSGKDSIRHWVEYNMNNGLPGGIWKPLSKGGKAWTNRVPGWEGRLTAALKELWVIALEDSAKHNWKGANNGKAEIERQDRACQTKELEERSMAYQDSKSVEQRPGDQNGVHTDSMDVLEQRSGPCDSERDRAFDDMSSLSSNGDHQSPAEPDIFAFLGEDSPDGLPEDDGRGAGGDDGGRPAGDDDGPVEDPGQGPADVRPAEKRSPNAAQLEAITSDPTTPLRVLAPPGSGKTFMLAYRYAHLLTCGAEPHQIVAVTFNRTMADELLERICKENPELAALREDDSQDDAVNQICTIHALCFRMLRAEGDRREVPGNGRVKNWQVKDALEKIIEDLWPVSEYRPGYKEVQAYIDTAKGHGLDGEHDMAMFDNVRDKWGNLVGQQLHQARRRFDEWCDRNRVLTFADMLFDVDMKLQKNPAFRMKWQSRYQYMMIDEGQDTSEQAMRILTTLAAPQNQITVVGDTDQLLYRFTGATPEANLYEGFESRYPEGKLVKLEVNYRSTREIINRYSRLIQNNYGEGRPYDLKYFKRIEPRPGALEGEPITFEMYQDAVSEARAVAQQIKQAIESGRKPGDFFVGARTCAQTGYLEGPLVQAGVPYINLVGTSFWTLKHVADVVGYVRLAFNEDDAQAFQQVYNVASTTMTYPWGKQKGEYCPHRFLGKAFLDACFDGETRQPQYKWRWQASKKRNSYQPGVLDLEYFLQELQGILAFDDVPTAIDYIVDNCYQQHLAHSEGITAEDASSNGKLDDIEAVKDIAAEFGKDVAAFLDYVQKAVEAAEAAQGGDWSEHVVISTVHRLKGLERPVVFGVGLVEGVDRQGNEVGLLPHTYSMRPPTTQGVLPTGGMGRIEDERDVCYVLVSRAQEEVHLTGCSTYRIYKMWPSRFVAEMGLLDREEESDDQIA